MGDRLVGMDERLAHRGPQRLKVRLQQREVVFAQRLQQAVAHGGLSNLRHALLSPR